MVRITDHLDMTSAVYCGLKATNQTNQSSCLFLQEEIIADVGKVCQYIPNANLSAMCTQYLKEYGPFVIDLLKTSQPEVICGLAKMCGTGKTDVPMFMVPIPEDLVEKTG